MPQTSNHSNTQDDNTPDFAWIKFYTAFADALLTYKTNRRELIAGIHAIEVEGSPKLQDRFTDGSEGPLQDICPFTVIALFNRKINNRKNLATELAKLLGVTESAPDSFEGIPRALNLNVWLFSFAKTRKPDDIDALWELFDQAIRFTKSDSTKSAFLAAYDNVNGRQRVGWRHTIGLYCVRPQDFVALDALSRNYIENTLKIPIGRNGPNKRCDAKDYLTVVETLKTKFQESNYPVHSFPELAYKSWIEASRSPKPISLPAAQQEPSSTIESYSVTEIQTDGCFLSKQKLDQIIERVKNKKNLILQGPPGTGKTWLAKRLAFTLIGQRDDEKIRPIQFHPNLSYEDFVRGWRPAADSKLELVDGPFVEMIEKAKQNLSTNYVVVIEEINRGNPAQIFGEMLTLLEADKRNKDDALALSYKKSTTERVFIPVNLFVIGTMNIADRSLALVDFAFRRRFAFVELEPEFNDAWQNWVHEHNGIDTETLKKIKERLNRLNADIAEDSSLGHQFRIGHSFFTPPAATKINDAKEWFRQVVGTEITPLLNEYWFDDLDKAKQSSTALTKDF